jgi:hypothetical protein
VLDLGDFAHQRRNVGDRFFGRWFEIDAFEKPFQLLRTQRRQDDLAECGAMGRPYHTDAVGQLKCAGAAGAGDHHHGIAHSHSKMATFAGFARKVLKHRRRDIHHLDFVERARRQRKQRPADAVALGILFLADIAERHHCLGKMKRGGVVQSDQLAQVCQSDPVTMTRDFLEDGEGTAERLNPTAALAVVGVVIDIGLRRSHQLGDRSLARACWLLIGLWLGTRSHRSHLHATVPHSIRPSERLNSALIIPFRVDVEHTTISIDVQYYEK